MTKYTHSNIIIDPTKEGIESLIGKEVYFSNIPSFCLDYANDNEYKNLGVLTGLKINDSHPFVVKCSSCSSAYICIIPKEPILLEYEPFESTKEFKEEPKPKPKYIPFENVTEFLDAYRNAPGCLNEEAFYLSKNGIWLKQKEPKAYVMVTEIWDVGVVIGDDKFIIDEESICNNTTDWGELLKDFTFLDNSPCGKVVEETNG